MILHIVGAKPYALLMIWESSDSVVSEGGGWDFNLKKSSLGFYYFYIILRDYFFYLFLSSEELFEMMNDPFTVFWQNWMGILYLVRLRSCLTCFPVSVFVEALKIIL